MNKAAIVAAGSSLASSCVIYNVWQQKHQFYPTVVHISKSSSCMAVFYIQAFSLVYFFAHIFRKIFFGTLRAAETEHLVERSWYALTETCLAFTVFRDDLSPSFIAQFAVLLFLKAFHWLLEDRIDFMERSPVIGFLFHLRALSLMGILSVCDAFLVSYAAHVTLQKGASVHLVFGFEYVVLLLLVCTILVKYILHLIDLKHESQWANKTIYLLYTELVIGGIKVLMYAMFVTMMIRVHTFPLFVIRPMYLALRQFQKTLVDVIKSRKATYNMRERYPDATPEEIGSGDNTCIICREEMTSAKKLPCGHIFHLECLRSWLLRQQTCPTCRIDILQQQQPTHQPHPPPGDVPPPGGAQGNIPLPNPPIFSWHNTAPPGSGGGPSSGATSSGSARFFIPTSGGSNFPIAGFAMPPPPPSLHSMTDEELRSFEGNTRTAIENRLIILKNVQMLMEAVQGQMQLYNSVAGPIPPSTFVSFTTQPDVVSGTGPASSSGPNSADQLFNPTPADTTPAGTTVPDTAATSANDTANLTNVNETVTEPTIEDTESEQERKQLRAARLAALHTPNTSSNGTVTSPGSSMTSSNGLEEHLEDNPFSALGQGSDGLRKRNVDDINAEE